LVAACRLGDHSKPSEHQIANKQRPDPFGLTEEGGADEDEGLAALPFAEPGECLAIVVLALIVGLGGEAGDRGTGSR